MAAIGMLFGIGGLGSGSYGFAAYRLLFEAVDTRDIPGARLRDGLTADTRRGLTGHFCIAIESDDPEQIALVRSAVALLAVPALPPGDRRFLDAEHVALEPLVPAGSVSAAGDLVGESPSAREAWQQSRAAHLQRAVITAVAEMPREVAGADAEPSGERASIAYRDTALLAVRGGGPALALLQRDDVVEVLAREADAVHVRTAAGHEGWVAAIAVRSAPTAAKVQPVAPGIPPAVTWQSPVSEPPPLRQIFAPSHDRARSLAESVGGVLKVVLVLDGLALGTVGIMLLGGLALSQGLWQLGAVLYMLLSLVGLVTGLVFIIQFLRWVYSATAATRELGIRRMGISPAGAVLLCFVPFGFLVVLAQLWGAGRPADGSRADGCGGRIAGLVALNGLGAFLQIGAFGALGAATDVGGLQAGAFLLGIALALYLAYVYMLRSFVEEIDGRFSDQHSHLRRLPAPGAWQVAAGVPVI